VCVHPCASGLHGWPSSPAIPMRHRWKPAADARPTRRAPEGCHGRLHSIKVLFLFRFLSCSPNST
jgi:hypothetical protein